jgi:hypothetical protein
MGWTVYYRGEADAPITDNERQVLARHVETWTAKLHEGSEAYGWKVEDGGTKLSGYTKIQYSEDDQGDYVTLIRAAQELEGLLPRFRFLVSDDYVVPDDTRPSEVEPE